jgi:hypothetical protein
MEGHEQNAVDPDGRRVVFDAGSHLHLAQGRRDWLLDHVQTILATVERPDYREDDPRLGRGRFYRQNALDPGRWLRVVVDFNDEPGWVMRHAEIKDVSTLVVVMVLEGGACTLPAGHASPGDLAQALKPAA